MLRRGVVAGRFEILALAAVGGMGTVYRARDHSTGTLVALKVASLETAGRLLREAEVLDGLDHPGIVRHIAHGTVPSGKAFLAMEWLEGTTLAERLRDGPLSVDDTVVLARRVLDALAYAHARGLVHRDLKPANLFLVGGDPRALTVLDFGLVRLGAGAPTFTGAGVTLGTPGYMAPEQATAEPNIDARADLFSLGAILYECLAGSPAFQAEHPVAFLAKIVFVDPQPLREFVSHVPPALDALVERLLAKSPGERVADAQSALRALDALDAGAAPVAPRLTHLEQRLLSVLLVVAAEEVLGACRPSLDLALLPFHAHVTTFANGALAVTLEPRGAAIDQATQAARCALVMRAHLPSAQIVVATGRAVVDAAPMGEVLDRAASLLAGSAGPRSPASVVVDSATAELLDSGFEVVAVDGGFGLRGERDALDRSRPLLGRTTPCIGREKPLAVLGDLFDACATDAVAVAVVVTGPPGIGKSRLRTEWIRRLRTNRGDAEVWVGRGDPLGAGSTFGMVTTALRQTMAVVDGEPVEARRAKVLARVARRVPAADRARVAAFLGELIGTPFPTDAHEDLAIVRQNPLALAAQVRRAWLEFVRAETRAHPVVLALEDLHWGDLPSVDLIDATLRELANERFMVVALARPEVHDHFPRLWHSRQRHAFELGPLPARACTELARQVLGEATDAAVIDTVVERAQGNAFFLEELLRAVSRGQKDSLPETVLATVAARLDALDRESRRALRAASVFGEAFWRGGVATLLSHDGSQRDVDRQLARLVDLELIVERDRARFPHEREYAFGHALVREAAYALLTDQDRALGHALAGRWLEDAGETHPMVLAEHFERGEELERAARLYVQAGEHSVYGGNWPAVDACIERAVRCGARGDALAMVRFHQVSSHSWRGEWARALPLVLPILTGGERRDQPWYYAASVAAYGGLWLGRPALIDDMFAALLQATPTRELLYGYIGATSMLVTALGAAGRRADARAILLRMAHFMGTHTDVDPLAVGTFERARAHAARFADDDPWLALRAAEAALAAYEPTGHLVHVLMVQGDIGWMARALGMADRSERVLRQMLLVAEPLGTTSVPFAKLYLARTLLDRGVLDEAEALAHSVAEREHERGNRYPEGNARLVLAKIALARGAHDIALDAARAALALLDMAVYDRAEALATVALAQIARGDVAGAEDSAIRAVAAIDAVGGGGPTEIAVRLARVEAARARGDLETAQASLGAATTSLRARADKIADNDAKTRFLSGVPENARVLALLRDGVGMSP